MGDLTASTLAAFTDHILARLSLFQLEAKEIRGELLFKLFVILTAFLFFALAYLTLLTGAIGMLTIHFDWSWPKVVLVTGGIHLFVAFLLLIIAKKRLSQTAFRDSLKEIEKDRQWLEDRQRQH
ncbi:MAG: phage holin family protein [Verrucomicrobiota bacterium]